MRGNTTQLAGLADADVARPLLAWSCRLRDGAIHQPFAIEKLVTPAAAAASSLEAANRGSGLSWHAAASGGLDFSSAGDAGTVQGSAAPTGAATAVAYAVTDAGAVYAFSLLPTQPSGNATADRSTGSSSSLCAIAGAGPDVSDTFCDECADWVLSGDARLRGSIRSAPVLFAADPQQLQQALALSLATRALAGDDITAEVQSSARQSSTIQQGLPGRQSLEKRDVTSGRAAGTVQPTQQAQQQAAQQASSLGHLLTQHQLQGSGAIIASTDSTAAAIARDMLQRAPTAAGSAPMLLLVATAQRSASEPGSLYICDIGAGRQLQTDSGSGNSGSSNATAAIGNNTALAAQQRSLAPLCRMVFSHGNSSFTTPPIAAAFVPAPAANANGRTGISTGSQFIGPSRRVADASAKQSEAQESAGRRRMQQDEEKASQAERRLDSLLVQPLQPQLNGQADRNPAEAAMAAADAFAAYTASLAAYDVPFRLLVTVGTGSGELQMLDVTDAVFSAAQMQAPPQAPAQPPARRLNIGRAASNVQPSGGNRMIAAAGADAGLSNSSGGSIPLLQDFAAVSVVPPPEVWTRGAPLVAAAYAQRARAAGILLSRGSDGTAAAATATLNATAASGFNAAGGDADAATAAAAAVVAALVNASVSAARPAFVSVMQLTSSESSTLHPSLYGQYLSFPSVAGSAGGLAAPAVEALAPAAISSNNKTLLLWFRELQPGRTRAVTAGPISNGNVTIAGTLGGHLVAVNALDGALIWRVSPPRSTGSVASGDRLPVPLARGLLVDAAGRVYLTTTSDDGGPGALYLLDGRCPPPLSVILHVTLAAVSGLAVAIGLTYGARLAWRSWKRVGWRRACAASGCGSCWRCCRACFTCGRRLSTPSHGMRRRINREQRPLLLPDAVGGPGPGPSQGFARAADAAVGLPLEEAESGPSGEPQMLAAAAAALESMPDGQGGEDEDEDKDEDKDDDEGTPAVWMEAAITGKGTTPSAREIATHTATGATPVSASSSAAAAAGPPASSPAGGRARSTISRGDAAMGNLHARTRNIGAVNEVAQRHGGHSLAGASRAAAAAGLQSLALGPSDMSLIASQRPPPSTRRRRPASRDLSGGPSYSDAGSEVATPASRSASATHESGGSSSSSATGVNIASSIHRSPLMPQATPSAVAISMDLPPPAAASGNGSRSTRGAGDRDTGRPHQH